MREYFCVCQVVESGRRWHKSTQIPAFRIDADNLEHAKARANGIALSFVKTPRWVRATVHADIVLASDISIN